MADADPAPSFAKGQAGSNGVLDVPSSAEAREVPRRWLQPVLMISLPLIIIAVAAYFWLTAGRFVSTDNAYVNQDKVSVSADVAGRIVQVDVAENQQIKAGTVLFRIDPEPYRIALEQADASLAAARVQVSTLATDTGSAAADISSANADIALANVTYQRQAALMARGFTTRASLDAAAHEVAAAKARLATAQALAARARSQLGSGTASSGSPAAIQAAMALRDKAALDLARTAVAAPYSGTISQSSRLQIGQMMITGLPAVSIVKSSRSWVDANFKETDLNAMRVGQPAEVTFDAYSGS